MAAEETTIVGRSDYRPKRSVYDRIADLPWWLIAASMFGVYLTLQIIYDEPTRVTFNFLSTGIRTTVIVALAGYSLSLTIGAIMGLARVSSNRLIYNVSSFYVEMVRGIPLLVFLFFIAFGVLPTAIRFLNDIGIPIVSRDIPDVARVVVALGLGYGAYSAEIFRAGIQSIERGQHEAAQALGMTYFQTMRFIVLPQAVRRVLPALGNDFVSMIKDSALVSVLGIRDLTQATKLYAASTFRFLEAWAMAAYLYLAVVIILTRGIRYMETRLQKAYQA